MSGSVFPPRPEGVGAQKRTLGFRREPFFTLLFSVLTCGFYYLYHIFVVSDEVRRYLDDDDTDPMLEVIFSILTCYLYTIYWDCKIARKIAVMQSIAGVMVNDYTIIYLLLNIFGLGFIPCMIQQNHLNEIWAKHRQDDYTKTDLGAF
jgi:hypothetical protein